MRKIILTVLVILAWEIFPNIGYAQFIDIEKDSLKYMVEHNIIQGYPDQTFKPKNPINRAEFLKIVLESSGIKTETPKKDCFPDIPKNEWFAPYIYSFY